MITMENIIRDGHETLRNKAEEVKLPISTEDKTTLDEMLEFLKNSQDETIAKKYGLRSGVGLAAPQINVSKKMLAVYIQDDSKGNSIELQLVNPKIVSHSVQKAYLPGGEGCLSVDESKPGLVHRNYKVTIEAFDIDGTPFKKRFKGYPAIVLQHEIDHLNGVMFYDYINQNDPFKPLDDAVEVN
ncbi:peptide deformylase [Mammaliicoccus sp. Dog046]|uniref:peptide deformylase n=1 Tax=Mammaliicoccus sp. Dog046 TaxID=3034233 RepID=UPI002B2595DF|nr:peptide deformylase [Mammaliicoccus sp. Dog046]WQK86712.1 peptide deformylase [Mammaliicoccus sp. Dog046]